MFDLMSNFSGSLQYKCTLLLLFPGGGEMQPFVFLGTDYADYTDKL